jgi:hypothetical protein
MFNGSWLLPLFLVKGDSAMKSDGVMCDVVRHLLGQWSGRRRRNLCGSTESRAYVTEKTHQTT